MTNPNSTPMDTAETHFAHPLTDAAFAAEVEQFDGVALVDFWAPWCGPCRVAGPQVEEAAKHFAEDARVKIFKLDVDENTETASKYSVMSIPSFKIFRNKELVESVVGVRMAPQLIELIDKQLAELPAAETPAAEFDASEIDMAQPSPKSDKV